MGVCNKFLRAVMCVLLVLVRWTQMEQLTNAPARPRTMREQKPPRTWNKRTPVNRQSGSAGALSPTNLEVPDPSPANLEF